MTLDDGVNFAHVSRVLAWLIRNEGVEPEAIERAVQSAREMKLGQITTLGDDPQASMRRAFVMEQVGLLSRISS